MDPGSQLELALIQSLGQQIQAGRAQARDTDILQNILPQAEQAQSPDDILGAILQTQLNPFLSASAKQQTLQSLQPLAQLAGQREQRSAQQAFQQAQQSRQFEQQNKLADRREQLEVIKASLKDQGLVGGSRGLDSLATTLDKLNTGEITLDQAESEILKNPSLEAAKLGAQQIRSRRTDTRVRDKLDREDPEVKLNIKTISGIRERARESKQVRNGIKRQIKLIESGKTSNFGQVLGESFPRLARYLKNPETVALEVEALEDLKGAIGLFTGGGAGARTFTDAKMRTFLDVLSRRKGTQQQQIAAAQALDRIMAGTEAANDALKRIKKENPGTRLALIPDLEGEIEDKMEDILNEINEEFEKSIAGLETSQPQKLTPQQRQKLISELQRRQTQ